ncbi:uncharacterized abhydrolase domain-containing protein DDB_G0269086-like isoform X32 [Portunus trituberculatus]|uniref:uncharacterized abhydrolase domain-containing protein DDB_G0269086-like isoform X32 n=1 Tax=Portunus trituberculatus TaxID=210409 RepID=UPI001E1CBD28|nr:uncharacterized abhydrolase domain-containing protein DDB_G0269086-like isoform X32 [Portunus trituberculatus]
MVLTPHHRTIMRSRSLSPRPRAPYLWHEREAESADRKGWYRVDYGSSKPEEMWYLPSFKDRMNFLERSVERATSEPRTRATSVPPTTVAVRRSRALSVDPLVKYPLRWRTSPFYYYNYRWPYTTFYDRYWPSLGPYSGRIWRLPWYRYPSSPLTASTYWRSYPPSRYVPRYYPSYLDYDYGYGGYYYPYHYPRASRYDYLEDLESSYLSTTTSYRPRALDLDTDYRDKTTSVTTTPKKIITTYKTYAPGMLHDHVENMRHRLKSLAYSLDPSGPVPEIVIPERSTTTTTITKKAAVPALPAPEDKKYSSSSSSGPRRQTFVEYPGGPPVWKRRALARFPHEDPEYVAAQCRVKAMPMDTQRDPVKEKEKLILKDRLSNRIHQFFNTTLNPEQFDKYLKTYREPAPQVKTKTQLRRLMPESSLRANKYSSTKWEEPDTVFGGPSDKKPYSKAISDGTTEEAGEEKKERRKKKKSKERDAEATAEATTASVTAAAAADHSTSEADPVSAVSEGDAGAGEDEEKERKKLEKKKRKQEREAAAKAAMEAELAALAAAEAELARLEAESSKTDAGSAAPAEAAPAEAAPAEVKRTDESEEPATTQAEEARLGAQDDTEAPADATATTTDAADATPDADAAADAADAATPAEAGTDDTADAADAAPSTRFDEDLAE